MAPAGPRLVRSAGSSGSMRSQPPPPEVPSQPLLVARPEDGRQKDGRQKNEKNNRKPDSTAMAEKLHQRAVILLHERHDLDGALEALNSAIELMPRAPGLLEDRGLLYRKLGRWTEAIQDYANARAMEERQAAEAERQQLSRGKSMGKSTSNSPFRRMSSEKSASAMRPAAEPAAEPAAAPTAAPTAASRPGSGAVRFAGAPIAAGGEEAADEEAEAGADGGDRSDAEGDDREYEEYETYEEDEESLAAAAQEAAAAAAESLLWGSGNGEADDSRNPELGMLAGGLRNLSDNAIARMLRAVETPPAQRSLEQSVLLSAALRAVPVLANLPEEARLRLCTGATVAVAEEEQVLQHPGGGGGEGAFASQGEDEDEDTDERGLFVMLAGEARLTRRVGSGGGSSSSVLRAGDHFGGIDILHRSIRTSGIVAMERCVMLVVSADEFRNALRRNKLEEAAEKAIFVASVPMFAKLPWERLLRMVRLLENMQFAHGETIVRQGDTPQGLYIVHDGRCTVTRSLAISEGGRTRHRRMHLETLMPRDTYGGDAILHGVLRSQTSLVAETDVMVLFMPRHEFSPAHLTEEALRMLKLNAKLYRPNDELLLQRHYQELEWDRAKKTYVKEVIREAMDNRTVKVMNSGNPVTMRRSNEG